jgi:hypothetical protein
MTDFAKMREISMMDWICRWLAGCYLEEKIGEVKDANENTKKLIKDFQKSCAEGMKECYEEMKKDGDLFKDSWIYQMFREIEDSKKEDAGVKQAKELLLCKGYKVTKK